MADYQINGFTDDRFAGARTAFEANIANGSDIGASYCATLDGKTVVDLWGGHADEARTRPWEEDTIVNVYSTTKTMTALCALLLADRGELDFSAPVARYWPEFAANGKDGVTVAHLMSHSAGLPGWDNKVTKEVLYDWEQATSLLAAQAPLWEPGTQIGYHAVTQGYLVGEVVRRISGQSLGTFFRTEIAEPLGADFHIGLPASEDHRVADLVPPPGGAAISDSDTAPFYRILNNPPINPLETRTRDWRAAEIPAAGGTSNARAVAEIHALLVNGGMAKGKQIMSEAGCRRALEFQIEGTCQVMNVPLRLGMGFGMPSERMPLPSPNTVYWGGYGGSVILIDFDKRTTLAYVMNKMAGTTVGDMRSVMINMAMWQALAA